MPMTAHTINRVAADLAAIPGEYWGVMGLEMLGVWAVEIDISGPVRDRVVRSLLVVDCEGWGRCAASPASPGDLKGGADRRPGRESHRR